MQTPLIDQKTGKPYRFLWFGDSHTVGSELAREHHHGPRYDLHDISPHYREDDDRPDLAFTSIISKRLGVEYTILGKGSTSYQFALHELLGWLYHKRRSQVHDTHRTCAILSTTAFQRDMRIEKDGKLVHISSDENDTYGIIGCHQHIAMFIELCRLYGMIPILLPLWHQWEDIPDDVPNTSPVTVDKSFLLNHGLQYMTMHGQKEIRFDQEILDPDSELLNTYIKPCNGHPNKQGHEWLADKILPDIVHMLMN